MARFLNQSTTAALCYLELSKIYTCAACANVITGDSLAKVSFLTQVFIAGVSGYLGNYFRICSFLFMTVNLGSWGVISWTKRQVLFTFSLSTIVNLLRLNEHGLSGPNRCPKFCSKIQDSQKGMWTICPTDYMLKLGQFWNEIIVKTLQGHLLGRFPTSCPNIVPHNIFPHIFCPSDPNPSP